MNGGSARPVVLIFLVLLLSIAVGISALLPFRMCPALVEAWADVIVSSQMDPKWDQTFLEHLRNNHRNCTACGGCGKVSLIQSLLTTPGRERSVRWVDVASFGVTQGEQIDETWERIDRVLTPAGIPFGIIRGSMGKGVEVPEQNAESAIRLLKGTSPASWNPPLIVIEVLRKGPGR